MRGPATHVLESRLLLDDPAGAAIARQAFGPRTPCPLVPPGWSDAQGLLAARAFAPRPQPAGAGSVLAGLAKGSVLYVGPGGVLAQDAGNFTYDPANHRLGVFMAAPAYPLDVRHPTGYGVVARFQSNAADEQFVFSVGSDGICRFGTGTNQNFVLIGNGIDLVQIVPTGDVYFLGGGQLAFFGLDSLSVSQPRAAIVPQVVDNTEATRKYRVVHQAFDTAAREYLRGGASGAAATIGVLGAAESARQTVTGSRAGNAALASLLSALALFGWITDSTTA